MQSVTIIGGTGFVGDYLVKELAGNSDLKLKVVYRNTPPSKALENVDYFQIDGSSEFAKLKNVLTESDYLVILSRPDKKLIQNIIKSDLKFRKILYASTILIYPNSKEIQNEDARLTAANSYEEEKIEEERKLSEFALRSGNKLTIARLTNVYGDIKNRALIHWILAALVKGGEFKLNNQGKPVRDFIFVEDAAKYLRLLLFLDQTSEVEIFNVCTGEGFSINQVIRIAEEVSGKQLKIAQGGLTDEKLCVIGDNRKIIMATGVKPAYNLKSGLKKAYLNYLKN